MVDSKSTELKSLLPKPFKNDDSLLRGLLEAVKTYGALVNSSAVYRTNFVLSEDIVIGADHSWVLEARIEGYGALTPEDTSLASLDEAQKLENLSATPLLTQSWKGCGHSLTEAAEALRDKLTEELNAQTSLKQAEAQRALDALNQLRAGSEGSSDAIWQEDPVVAEVHLENIVDHPEMS